MSTGFLLLRHAAMARMVLCWACLAFGFPAAIPASAQTRSATAPDRVLTLATGTEAGFYHAYGCAISNVLAASGITLQVVTTSGSHENLGKLLSREVDFCLVQSDIAYDCLQGEGVFKAPATNLVAAAALYTEALHILIRENLNIRRIQDLTGKRLELGALGSGTEITARRLLDAAGISINEINPSFSKTPDALRRLDDNEADAAFLMTGIPLSTLHPLLEKKGAHLLPPNIDVCERLVADYSPLVMTTIPRNTYPNQHPAIHTIGIRTLLVGRADAGADAIKAISAAVDACITNTDSKFQLPLTERSLSMDSLVPMHPASLSYYRESGLSRQCTFRTLALHGAGWALVAGMIALLIRFGNPRRWRRSSLSSIIFSALLLMTVWTIGSLILYFAERRINDSYGTLFQSFWSSLVNWVSFGQKEPFTVAGRTTTAAMAALGTGGLILFGNRVWKKVKTMKNHYSNHYVVVNWNSKGEEILDQLNNPDLDQKSDVVVILPCPSTDYQLQDDDLTTYLDNEKIEVDTLNKAGVRTAASVIILADEKVAPATADAQTILAILCLVRANQGSKRALPVVAEICMPENVEHANLVGATQEIALEVVSASRLGANLISQAAVNHGVTALYADLISFGKGTNEIYVAPIPSRLENVHFADVRQRAAEIRNPKSSLVLIGIKRGRKVMLNPPDIADAILQPNDAIFGICDDMKTLTGFLSQYPS